MSDALEALRYPIGHFEAPAVVSPEQRSRWIDEIEAFPARFRRLVEPFSQSQLDTPYRPEGWTVRQLVHHVPDSHLNSYVRFKWALTEPEPTIKPYDEARWAELPDAAAPVAVSLDFLEALHVRWGLLLRGLTGAQWERRFDHPESGIVPLGEQVGIYAWHGRHHYEHIAGLARREGWPVPPEGE